jgi:small-conductance mechanosensitive channel
MMKTQTIVLLGILLALAPFGASQAENSVVETARADLNTLMSGWAKHRHQKIAVLTIRGLDDAAPGANEKTLLETRLETLQRKKISNREWASYWKGEAEFSEKVSRQYGILSPAKGTPPLKAESRRAMMRAEDIRASIKRELAQRLGTTQAALKTAETALRDSLSQRARDAEKRRVSLEQAVSSLDRLSAQARSAENEADRRKVLDELKALQAQHESLRSNVEREKSAVDGIRLVLSGGELSEEVRDVGVRTVVNRFVTAREVAKVAAMAIEKAEAQANDLVMASARMSAEDQLFRARRPGLQAWAAVATKKVKNQKVYYDAIQSDIASINERIRSFKEPSKDEVIYADDVCGRPLSTDETPFAHHRACVSAIALEIDRLNTELEQATDKRNLTDKLSQSNTELGKAQVTDERLVREERQASAAEQARAASVPTEDASWTKIWTEYAERAGTKESSLSEAVLTSKKSRRMLDAKRGVLTDTIKRLETQIQEMNIRLERTDTIGIAVISLLTTSLQIVKVGWPALIYIFFAWLLIRSIRRYRDRKEARAVAAQEGDGNEELAELMAQLEAARSQGDEQAQAELHEEMGQLESRIKDENQRIATIARVAAQALSLVIYVATFLLVLDALTVDIGPILGGAAIFGLAISFGSQSLVKDVVSGFFILLENQYAVGDVVSINDQSGTVEKVTLRRTVLRDLRGGVHNITNGSISSVINSTQGWSRVLIHMGVAYGTDIDLVRDVVNREGEAMYADPEWSSKLTEKPTFVGVTAFGESEITVRVWFKTKTFQNWGAEREFNLRLKGAFEAAGIDIPFPQRTVHMIQHESSTPTDER